MSLDPEKLLPLLTSPDPAHFQQGIELLRCVSGVAPQERLVLARLLLEQPDRALAVLCDTEAAAQQASVAYGQAALRALAAAEAARRPEQPLPPALRALLSPAPDPAAVARGAAAAAGLEGAGELTDPGRYAALRLLQGALALQDAAPEAVAPLLRRLIHTLSHLEPRRLYTIELREREALCRAALEAVVEAQVQALLAAVSPASGPDRAGASSASAPDRRPPGS